LTKLTDVKRDSLIDIASSLLILREDKKSSTVWGTQITLGAIAFIGEEKA
jgi:hypothetical protein